MITLGFNTIFDVNQRKFKIQDTTNYSGQGVPLSNVKGVIKINTPRGVTYNNTNYSIPDIIPSSSLFSGYIALPTNAQGYILAGTYTVEYSVLNSGDSSVSTLNQTYTYSFIVPAIAINQAVDGYNSTFTSTDNSIYGSYSSLIRTHEVTPPSGSPLSVISNSNQIISYTPNIWSGIWTSQITSVLIYIEGDGLIINASLTATETITAYLNDMDVIRGYIEIFKLLYDQARATNKELAYRIELSLNKINTSYVGYDLALFYNDLTTAYLRTVDIVTELSDYITIVFPEQIIPFVNSQGGSSHSPVSINTPAFGVSINSSQVLSFSLATNSNGGMSPMLSGNATDYLGGDGVYHSLTSGTYALKSDFAAYSAVTAITAANITNWQISYSWGNHALAGYALAINIYTKTELQTSGSSSVHWGNITNKPTTLLGYGITDGMQGNIAIVAATHTKITYDSKGLVTGGVDLSVSDIPNLPWSKITSGLPTTLAGYGVTDAYTKTEVDNKTWDFTSAINGKPTTLAGYGIINTYTKTETLALTWAWNSITGTPTTLAGYGITNGLSTSSPAASVINTGLGTMFLSDDGTYKLISTTIGGSNTQLIYNNSGAYAGSSSMVFDGTTTTIANFMSPLIQIGDATTTITRDGSYNLTFYDAVVATPYTLAQLVGTATNFWIPNNGNIWYGQKVGIGGIGTFTESLEVTGSILADNFSTKYFRRTSTGNLLIGINAGDQETGNDKLYIHNNNSTSPIIYGDFITKDLTFSGNITIPNTKALTLGTTSVQLYSDVSNNLYFKDAIANSGIALSLSDLRSGSYYSLVSAYSDHSAVLSITTSSKNIWDRAQYIILTGDGTKYLSDNGVYNTITGSLVVTDNILKWDTSTFRPYATKSEAGGTSSNGKLYRGIDTPTATDRLNYDGYLHSTLFIAHNKSATEYGFSVIPILDAITGIYCDVSSITTPADGVGIYSISTTGIAIRGETTGAGNSIQGITAGGTAVFGQCNGASGTGVYAQAIGNGVAIFANTNGTGTGVYSLTANGYGVNSVSNYNTSIRGESITGSILSANQIGISTTSVTSNVIGIVRSVAAATYDITGDIINIIDNPTTSGTISGSVLKATIDSTVRMDFNPRMIATGGTAAYILDTHNTLIDGSILSIRNNGVESAYLNAEGMFRVNGTFSCSFISSVNATSTAISSTSTTSYAVRALTGSGYALYGSASSGYAIYGTSTTSNATICYLTSVGAKLLVATLTGTPSADVTNDIISINRNCSSSTFNITNNIINIVDNPVSSGTISGSILKATIDTTVRIDLNPRVANESSAIAYLFDTNINLTTSGAKLVSIKNAGTELVYIDSSGVCTGKGGYYENNNPIYAGSGVLLAKYTGSSNYPAILGYCVDAGYGVKANTIGLGSALYVNSSGVITGTNSTNLINILREQSGTGSNTGNIINIVDNPSISGTISGSIFKATISSTTRIDMNPRVVDSLGNYAYIFDTNSSLSSAGLLSILNNGNSRVLISRTGRVTAYDGYTAYVSATYYTAISNNTIQITSNSVIRTSINPEVSDGASVIAYTFDTHNVLSTSGAKIASWKNQGTEKASITKDGYIYHYGTYADIYVNNGTATQSIPSGSTYTKITPFTTNGESSNCTSDQTNDKITITKPGRYLVTMSFSTSIDTNGVTFRTALFVGGTEANNIHTLRVISNSTGTSSSSVTGIINVSSANTDIDVRTYHDSGSAVLIQVVYGNLNVEYLGD